MGQLDVLKIREVGEKLKGAGAKIALSLSKGEDGYAISYEVALGKKRIHVCTMPIAAEELDKLIKGEIGLIEKLY